MKGIVLAVLLALALSGTAFSGESSLKRGRNEGTMNMSASNTVGNGNITVYAGSYGSYGTPGAVIDPAAGICVGLADIMQISGRMTFTNFKGLGTSEAHLLLTMPGNDRLRFFGCALSGDLYLTTTVDTLSGTSLSGKPEYGSFMLPSGIVDFDWLALNKTIPLKTYFAVSMADEPGQLYRYDQISIRTGFEWKMYQHCAFVDAGAGLYREKNAGARARDDSYKQRIAWLEPGMRYRISGAWSLTGSLRVTAYRDLKKKAEGPLPVPFVRGAVIVDMPVLFKETNTEAIRTLVFMDRVKEKKKDNLAKNIEQGRQLDGGLNKELKSINMKSDLPDQDREKEALEKREAIQQKLDDLEKLLDETQ